MKYIVTLTHTNEDYYCYSALTSILYHSEKYEDSMPKSCPLSDKKDLQKKERGYFEHSITRTDGILVVLWDDNCIIKIAMNRYGVSPVTNVRRYSRKEKKHIQRIIPPLVKQEVPRSASIAPQQEHLRQLLCQ
nr:unnamed protein product [Callosobruchus analis]